MRRQVEGLRIAIAVMQGDPAPQVTSTKSTEYQRPRGHGGSGGSSCGASAGAAKTSRSMADELIARGLADHPARTGIAAVYATLRNGKKISTARRTERWVLVEGEHRNRERRYGETCRPHGYLSHGSSKHLGRRPARAAGLSLSRRSSIGLGQPLRAARARTLSEQQTTGLPRTGYLLSHPARVSRV